MSDKKVLLGDIAYARSGDKCNTSNIGVVAKSKEDYELIKRQVTPERVKALFGDWVKGDVKRYEVPGIDSFEFVMHQALGGGTADTLRIDICGKALCTALLRLELERG